MKFGVSTQRCEHCAVAMRVDFQVVDVLLVKLSRHVKACLPCEDNGRNGSADIGLGLRKRCCLPAP